MTQYPPPCENIAQSDWTQLPDSFTLYLARHATPDRSNPDIPYHIIPGPELTERGLAEATELGEFFEQAGIGHVLASPLERTWRTATIASAAVGLQPERCDDLHEIGLEKTAESVLERIRQAFHSAALVSQTRGPVALVTHGGLVLTLLKGFGLPSPWIERHRIYDTRNPIPPAGAWRFERVDGSPLSAKLVFAPSGVRFPLEISAGLGD